MTSSFCFWICLMNIGRVPWKKTIKFSHRKDEITSEDYLTSALLSCLAPSACCVNPPPTVLNKRFSKFWKSFHQIVKFAPKLFAAFVFLSVFYSQLSFILLILV